MMTSDLTNRKVSVIIPSFNREKTIERCINSIINQTIAPYEIIVVDDGSTDGTIKILENLVCDYLKIIKQNHKGAQAARNLGIMNASGEYIAFLDSDDEWMPQMIETCLKYICNGNTDSVLYGDGFVVEGNKKRALKLPGEKDMHSLLLRRPGPMFQSMMVRKERLIQIGLLDEKVIAYQEWDTAIRLSKICKFVHIKKPLFIYYRQWGSGEGISKTWKNGVRGYHYIVQKHKRDILEKNGVLTLFRHYKTLGFWIFKAFRNWLQSLHG